MDKGLSLIWLKKKVHSMSMFCQWPWPNFNLENEYSLTGLQPFFLFTSMGYFTIIYWSWFSSDSLHWEQTHLFSYLLSMWMLSDLIFQLCNKESPFNPSQIVNDRESGFCIHQVTVTFKKSGLNLADRWSGGWQFMNQCIGILI